MVQLSKIGFGTGHVGRPNLGYGWYDSDSFNFRRTLDRARYLGINWVDTAPLYGFGLAEELIGKDSSGLLISSKCGRIWDQQYNVRNDLTVIRQECENSLIRLKTDAIHYYQIHWPGKNPGETDPNFERAWASMADLKKKGDVVNIGGSNFTLENIKQAQKIAPIDFVQLPYNPLRRDIEKDILPYCKQQKIMAITYSPLQSGLFSGHVTRKGLASLTANDWRHKNKYFQEPLLSEALETVLFFSKCGEMWEPHISPSAMAVAWNLHEPAVNATIVGFRNPRQVEEMVSEVSRALIPVRLGNSERIICRPISCANP
jgi:aryl-alcohol dehydrogenase-like predicted oxidoreductase